MSAELKRALLKGGLWLGLTRAATRGSGVLKNVILARLLAPDDIGLFGVVLIALSLGETLTNLNVQHALLSKRNHLNEFADAAWTLSTARGLLLSGVLFAASRPLVKALGLPDAAPLLQAVAFVPAIQGLQNPLLALVRFRLDYRLLAYYELGVLVSQHGVVVVGVVLRPSVWTLAIGLLVGEAVGTALSYVLVRYRPRVEVRWSRLKDLLHFSKWMTATALVLYVVWQLDSWVVSVTLGAAALGYYQMARRLSVGLITDLAAFVQAVTMPAYANLAENRPLRKRVLLMSIEIVALTCLPLCAGSLLLSEELVVAVLGLKWLPAAGVIRVLSVTAVLIALPATGGPLFYALGEPRRDTEMNLARAIVLALTIVPLVKLRGLEGAGMATLLSCATLYPFWIHHVKRLADVGWVDVLRALGYPCVFTLAVVGLILVGRSTVPPGLLPLLGLVGASVALYAGLVTWWGLTRGRGPVGWIFTPMTVRRAPRTGEE